jgi:Domain of unknown function (DUF397)
VLLVQPGVAALGEFAESPLQKGHHVDPVAQDGANDARLDGVTWRKSQHSNPSGNCVEIAKLPDGAVAIRNSRYPAGPALICALAEFSAFLAAARDGEFDSLLG